MNRNIDFIPFAKPSISVEEEQAVLAVLRSGWLTTGRVAQQFEEEFAAFSGARYALAVNSATAGLHLSLVALKIPPRSLVITTPYTFTASAEIIRYLQADPLFVDIDSSTYNIDPGRLEKALAANKGRVSAILPVHLGGLPCRMTEICRLAGHYRVPVVEDAAHCFPVETAGRFIGTFGATGVFSFYANKTITTGEGGMVVTDDEALAKHIRIMRLHGIDRESWDRYTRQTAAWFYQVVEAGFKYNMPDLAAAIGREQLKKANHFLMQRRKIAARYIEAFADCDFLITPRYSDCHAWHLFLLRLKPELLRINRDEFIDKLQQRGIGISVHYIPLHIMPFYQTRYHLQPRDFPAALENYLSSLSLPIYPGLTETQVEYIIAAVKETGFAAYNKNLLKSGGL